MPFIRVELLAGRTLDQRRAFARAVTLAACEHLETEPQSVRIVFAELDGSDLARGGVLNCDKPADEAHRAGTLDGAPTMTQA